MYRVTHLRGKNLLLTWFRHFWQLVGRYCSYLLLRQDDGTSQIQVNRRFSPRWVTLHINDELTDPLCLTLQYPLAADADGTLESASEGAMPQLKEGDFQASIVPEGYFQHTV